MNHEWNSWVEVDVDALLHNLDEIKRIMQPSTRLMAVLKSRAYGLGAPEIARQLALHGVEHFAVTFLSEALELRAQGIDKEILVFSPLNEEEILKALEEKITITVGGENDVNRIIEGAEHLGKKAKIHIKVDTGLGRFGLDGKQVLRVAKRAKDSPHVYLEGIYTHLADAPGSLSYSSLQFKRFMQVVKELEEDGILIPVKHCCNSAAFLRFPHMHLDAVRIGTLLSGQYPAGRIPQPLNLKDVFSFKAKVIAVRSLPKGSFLGYQRTHRLKKEARIAVVAAGWADGFGVEPMAKPSGILDLSKHIAKLVFSYLGLPLGSNKVYFGGKGLEIRGKIFMQFCLVEIPSELEVKEGDAVVLPARRVLVAGHVPRLYFREGRPYRAEKAVYQESEAAGYGEE